MCIRDRCGGTFDGINNVIERRVKGSGIGFNKGSVSKLKLHDNLSSVQVEDIIKYAMMAENNFIKRNFVSISSRKTS